MDRPKYYNTLSAPPTIYVPNIQPTYENNDGRIFIVQV